MNILGLNYICHESKACLVRNGKLVVTLREGRLTRQKHTDVFPEQAITHCLEIARLTPKDIDHIAISPQQG
jgi:carbamoyltransferase